MTQTLYLLVGRSSENFAQITLSFHDISLLSLPLLTSFPNGLVCTKHSFFENGSIEGLYEQETVYFMPIAA